MKAKPNTIVEDLAICSNCGGGLKWIELHEIWVHMGSGKRPCNREGQYTNG